ncbi:hypothetical protein AX17_002377 [Amanita inopinata Kibby_2008]|nr:hypothetical protein AX17_002377 [Amanita inopinata Kibby_2008]
MPHHCEHNCHDHSHGDGTSDSEPNPQDNLYMCIDRQNVVALNTSNHGSEVIKPWHDRADENVFVESEADDQIIVRIPFTGSVRLRAILLKAGPAEYTPSKVLLFANDMSVDFEDVAEKLPTQEITVAQGRAVGEYAVKTAKFNNISSIGLYFPSSWGGDVTRIYYIGFLGYWTKRNDKPVITVYEAQPNIADHAKIQGTEGNFNVPQL